MKRKRQEKETVSKSLIKRDSLLVIREQLGSLWSSINQNVDYIHVAYNGAYSGSQHPHISCALNLSILTQSRKISVAQKRFKQTLSNILQQYSDKKVVWINIYLRGDIDHYQALWIDQVRKHVYVFESHGSDLQNASQPTDLYDYYDSENWHETVLGLLKNVFRAEDSWKISMPRDYLPAMFGQSVTRDPGCFFWPLWFFFNATRFGENGPEQYSKDVQEEMKKGKVCFDAYVSEKVEWFREQMKDCKKLTGILQQAFYLYETKKGEKEKDGEKVEVEKVEKKGEDVEKKEKRIKE